MPFVPRRVLMASALSAGIVVTTLGSTNADAAIGQGSPANAKLPTQNVIVVLRNQHNDLAITKGQQRGPRIDAAARDQAPLMANAQRSGARNVHGFKTLNGFAATVTPEQAAQLSADPAVQGVFPDLQVRRRLPDARTAGPAAGTKAAAAGSICPTDPAKPLLEPEALQTTHTAFADPAVQQAQSLVDGNGVKVAWLADGMDPNNPDFIRADGSHVFVDFQDFSGEGPNAPSSGAEAFGDASAIAAQGRQVYDLADFVNPAHPLPPGCTIRVLGMAPGASLVGLKVFGNAPSAPTSRFIEAIDYAVNVAGVDVINESFGANPFPDLGNDPISLADNAAVDAGVTVVASTGDAGTNGTIGTPASGPKIIGVAGTTNFRSYLQTTFAGAQFSNGTWASDNISSLSSGGVTQQARVPDLSAPGDLGWALCSTNVDVYLDCLDYKNAPSPIQNFGGTSQSSPLVAGAVALVIQAYKKTHGGVRPSPALVKQLLTSTATDLGHPAYEQGAGEVNTLAAVRAAMSWKDRNGSPDPVGTALVVDNTQLTMVGQPGSTGSASFSVRNVSRNTQTVKLSTRTLGRVVTNRNGSVNLNTATAPSFLDAFGIARSYVTQTFTVPVGVDRLDVSLAANSPISPPRVILIDPHGTYTAYSIPQGGGNFGHVDVHFPGFGTWTAIFALSKSSGFNGPILFNVKTSNFTTHGTVNPSTLTLAPGQSRSVTVHAPLPGQPGDLSESVQLSTALGVTTSVPLTLRALVPTSRQTNTFTGVITGGNGRPAPAQSNVYYIDVPAGKKDLGIGFTMQDPNTQVFGILTSPEGQVSSYQSNLFVDLATGDLLAANTFQLYRRNPMPGRWILSLQVNNPVSGLELQQRFTATVAFNTVNIQANVPNNARTVLAAGQPVEIPVKITNTGVAPLTYFADGRLNAVDDIPLAELTGASTVPLPVPPGVFPQWLVPTDTNRLTVATSADQPVNLDVFYSSGEPEKYSAAQGNGATVRVNAAQVSPGLWASDIGQHGPFTGPAQPGTASVAAVARGQVFDPAVTSTTGDVWQAGVESSAASNAALAARLKAAGKRLLSGAATATASTGPTANAVDTGPVQLDPGESFTITVTITPNAPHGTVVRGHLYIDTFSFFTLGGDELIDLPYAYTVG
jgi:hypothetical protein